MRMLGSYTTVGAVAVAALAACSFDTGGIDSFDGGDGVADASVDGAANIDSGTADAGADAAVADAAPDAMGTPDGMPDAIGTPDAAPDAMGTPDALTCPGDTLPFLSNMGPCDVPTPGAAIDLGADNWLLDTSSGTLMSMGGASVTLSTDVVAQTDAPDILVVSADDITIGAGAIVRVVGPRGLALVSQSNIVIAGTLEAPARGPNPGAGGDHGTACASGFGDPGPDQTDSDGDAGGGGGGGGGYGGKAGPGGVLADSDSSQAAQGGDPSGDTTITPLRGGCRGGSGGGGGPPGGGGGGAIQLVAQSTISIPGVVSVAGGGGAGATVDGAGGAGGGSGGAILLEAAAITIDGAVTANGGGGGEGRRTLDGGNGQPGHADDAVPAAGGTSQFGYGGDGGDGGADSISPEGGDPGMLFNGTPGGGGGGGGSVGRIHVNATGVPAITGVVSPPAM